MVNPEWDNYISKTDELEILWKQFMHSEYISRMRLWEAIEEIKKKRNDK